MGVVTEESLQVVADPIGDHLFFHPFVQMLDGKSVTKGMSRRRMCELAGSFFCGTKYTGDTCSEFPCPTSQGPLPGLEPGSIIKKRESFQHPDDVIGQGHAAFFPCLLCNVLGVPAVVPVRPYNLRRLKLCGVDNPHTRPAHEFNNGFHADVD